jgi:hypothetical protein
MSLAASERRRLLSLMDIDVYLPRADVAGPAVVADPASTASTTPCILIRLDRPKHALDADQKRMLGNILKAMQWTGTFRQDDPQGDRAVLEIAFGVPASGKAEVSIETDAVDRLAAEDGRKRTLWIRLKAELPRLRTLQP